jgi:cytochrome b subunit of formate dehydrogenase
MRIATAGHRRKGLFSFLCVLLCAAVVLLLVFTVDASGQTQAMGRSCVSCHESAVYRADFPSSAHGNNGCASCHIARNLATHTSGTEKPALVSCGKCHGEIAAKFRKNAHFLQQNFECQDCHRDIHTFRKKPAGDFKVAVVKQCMTCHAGREYVELGHGNALLQGNRDSAACSDCHGVHDTPLFRRDGTMLSPEARVHYTARCVGCHGDRELERRNRLRPGIVKAYEETYHGKILKAGDAARVAGCADCHKGHNILPKENPRSNLTAENLRVVCGQCHSRFHPRAVNYVAHPVYHDYRENVVLYLTYIFMLGLLASVFIFFGIHTLLWWRRAYWQECEEGDVEEPGSRSIPGCDDIPSVRRFTIRDRVMHVLLILSFLTLVMTGMPLKYSGAPWTQHLFGLLGGVKTAGILHRVAATILWGLFLYTCWLSYKFLFPKGQGVKGWLGRLFGPDSLFFNLKDWEDIKGMFRWFFNRGDVPKFDRWTYWEKFDFFAVFWGMTAIGLSGLILWFPEESSYIMPGWLISVAYLVHSEEALLAALFIFIMHFFHNHMVPGKFPLEPNIFTGCYRLTQLRKERPVEYDRIMAEGRLESMKCGRPGVWTELFAAAFGLASVFIGLTLAFLILWAIFLA